MGRCRGGSARRAQPLRCPVPSAHPTRPGPIIHHRRSVKNERDAATPRGPRFGALSRAASVASFSALARLGVNWARPAREAPRNLATRAGEAEGAVMPGSVGSVSWVASRFARPRPTRANDLFEARSGRAPVEEFGCAVDRATSTGGSPGRGADRRTDGIWSPRPHFGRHEDLTNREAAAVPRGCRRAPRSVPGIAPGEVALDRPQVRWARSATWM